MLGGGRRGRRALQGTTPSDCSPYAPQHFHHHHEGERPPPTPRQLVLLRQGHVPAPPSPQSPPTQPLGPWHSHCARPPCQGWQPTATIAETRPTQTGRRTRSEAPTCLSIRTSDAFGGNSKRHALGTAWLPSPAQLPGWREAAGTSGPGGGATAGAEPLRQELPDWPPRGGQGRACRSLARSWRGGAASSQCCRRGPRSRASPRTPGRGGGPGRAEPGVRPRAGRRGAEPYQRGQLAARPCASAPAQFNGHCPPAPLFRRRPLPAGTAWDGRAGNAPSRGPDAEAAPARGQRRRPPAPGAPWAWGRGPGGAQPSAQLGVAGVPSQGGRKGRRLARPLLGRRGWGLGP